MHNKGYFRHGINLFIITTYFIVAYADYLIHMKHLEDSDNVK
jgi:hypothetical protein